MTKGELLDKLSTYDLDTEIVIEYVANQISPLNKVAVVGDKVVLTPETSLYLRGVITLDA
jgi:hypothetical protein